MNLHKNMHALTHQYSDHNEKFKLFLIDYADRDASYRELLEELYMIEHAVAPKLVVGKFKGVSKPQP